MTRFSAILNGHRTSARKVKGRWLVGGDVTQKGDNVSILLQKDGRPAWFNLHGCFLKFSDYAAEDEIQNTEF